MSTFENRLPIPLALALVLAVTFGAAQGGLQITSDRVDAARLAQRFLGTGAVRADDLGCISTTVRRLDPEGIVGVETSDSDSDIDVSRAV